MVTLNEQDSIKFLNSLHPQTVFARRNTAQAEWTTGSLLYARTHNGQTTGVYGYTRSGTIVPTYDSSLVKRFHISKQFELRLGLGGGNGLLTHHRFNCGNTFPNAIPNHQPLCVETGKSQWILKTDTAASTQQDVYCPIGTDTKALEDYIISVANNGASKIRSYPWDASISPLKKRVFGRYIYLNDLEQHKQPFGPTSHRSRM